MSRVDHQKLYSLILAAGAATRFGSPKQLALLGGETLLTRAAALAQQVTGARRLAVTGAHTSKLLPLLNELGLAFAHNPGWADGPGSSIAAGIRALPHDCTGVLIWHADQVLLNQHDMFRLRDCWLESSQRIVAAYYAGSVGAPVIFPRRLFEALLAIDARSGAKKLILTDASTLQIPLESAAFDVDTPDDLAKAQLALSRAHDSRNARS